MRMRLCPLWRCCRPCGTGVLSHLCVNFGHLSLGARVVAILSNSLHVDEARVSCPLTFFNITIHAVTQATPRIPQSRSTSVFRPGPQSRSTRMFRPGHHVANLVRLGIRPVSAIPLLLFIYKRFRHSADPFRKRQPAVNRQPGCRRKRIS